MASFAVRENQENRAPVLSQKHALLPGVHQKRPALGAIENLNDQKNKNLLEAGNCIKVQGINNRNKQKSKLCVENAENKENVKAVSSPVVPVAQFEAFNVYDDEKQTRHRKLKQNDLSNIYKGTNEDRFITKKELVDLTMRMQDVEEFPKMKKNPNANHHDNSMSLDKSFEGDTNKENEYISKFNSDRDRFFEVEEYRSLIYQYLRQKELLHRPKPGYMKKQNDITYNMRTILVDWLVEVTEEYKMHTETLYLAVNFIDRFLSYMSVVRAKLQLVGTAAMFIASKYEEIYPPEVSEFVYITDDTYSKKQVLRMEHLILKVLSFDLSIPTPLTFITGMSVATKQTKKTTFLAMYLSELAMLDAEPYLETLPSVLAASAIALARHSLDEQPWSEELHQNTGYKLKHLQTCIEFLNSTFIKAPKLAQQAIQEKYSAEKYLHVAKLTPRDAEISFNED